MWWSRPTSDKTCVALVRVRYRYPVPVRDTAFSKKL
ncbi:hypothetical protein A2U01_0074355, partial [Trifolium medium]|nr:hypothetical protein [Trifolium medium]